MLPVDVVGELAVGLDDLCAGHRVPQQLANPVPYSLPDRQSNPAPHSAD